MTRTRRGWTVISEPPGSHRRIGAPISTVPEFPRDITSTKFPNIPSNWSALFRPARERHDLPPAVSSVLATFVLHDSGPSFLFTRRTRTLSAFAGDLSFPGGRFDASDETPLRTALRETEEEIGIPPERIHVLGHFTELDTHLGTLVVCYAGAIGGIDVPRVPTSLREVEEILVVPIDSLLRPTRLEGDLPERTYRAVRYEGRRIGPVGKPARTLHYWTLENPMQRERTILWGLTAEIVARFLRAAYGWTPPTEPRLVTSLEEFQP